MPSFEIPDSPATVVLKEQTVQGKTQRTGAASFSITNKTNQPLAGRLSVVPQGNAKAEWFEVMGEAQRNFAAAETQQATVNVTVSGDAPAGNYTFRLRIVNVNDPDNDYTDGATASFKVPEVVPSGGGGFPTWAYIAIAVALVVIVGGVLLFLRPSPKVTVTDTVGKTFADASAELTNEGLDVTREDVTPAGKTPGTVVKQDPPKDSRVAKHSTVKLSVAGAVVPQLHGKTFQAAYTSLRGAGLTVGKISCVLTTPPFGTIQKQSRSVGTLLRAGTAVDVGVGQQLCGIIWPNVLKDLQLKTKEWQKMNLDQLRNLNLTP